MARTLTVEGDQATVDVEALCATLGSTASPSLIVSGDRKIVKIIASAGADGNAFGSGCWILRLSGSAIKNGTQEIPISAMGSIDVQAGSDAAPCILGPLVLDNVDIDVGTGTIVVDTRMCGSDLGTGYASVTLEFDRD